MTIGHRLSEIRTSLGLSQSAMAERVGVKRGTWSRYETGDVPTGEPLEMLARLGFSINWVLTGMGSMRTGGLAEGPTPFEHPQIEAELMGSIIAAVTKLFIEENLMITPGDQGRLVAGIYNDIAWIADESERRGVLRYAIEVKRRELRSTSATPGSRKRQTRHT